MILTTSELLTVTNGLPRYESPTESDYYQRWQTHCRADLSPEAMAFLGGYLADRLAWLFIAGYQGTVRRTFAEPLADRDLGWAALAVSEDRSSDNPLPGLMLRGNTLSGNKTWVAACNLVRTLIVTAGPDDTLLLVDRQLAGLSIKPKSGVSFLGEMSQGIAHFKDADITGFSTLPSLPLKVFARREPLYLYLAFAGFLHRLDRTRTELMDGLLQVAADTTDDMSVRKLFADLDRAVTDQFNALPENVFNGNYSADAGLMSLYSKGIQRRASPRPA